ncbi:MAG TPA: hypothetical protein VFQ53_11360 [Kofleriaceae bacterium]|nr:hypothetical protein [Kofleriaceae bacterium]
MAPDFSTLVHDHHLELEQALLAIAHATPRTPIADIVDGLWLGFVAHAEAHSVVLQSVQATDLDPPDELRQVADRLVADHLQQEHALRDLIARDLSTRVSRQQALQLYEHMRRHDRFERDRLHPLVVQLLDADSLQQLAASYTIERMRVLGLMRPSAPVEKPRRELRV